jgi:hypothetical protein
MKWALSFVLLFSIAISSYSQADSLSIADRIAATDYSKSDIISKSRRLLLQEFDAGNKTTVSEIMQYLATEIFVKDYPYSPLTPAARKFISYKLTRSNFGFGMSKGQVFFIGLTLKMSLFEYKRVY